MTTIPPPGLLTSRRLCAAALLAAGLAYPFAVHLGRSELSPRLFAVLLGGLWLLRSLLGGQNPGGRLTAAAALAFCLLLGLANEASLLLWYPVLISLALLGLFGASLVVGPPVIERLARLREPDLPAYAVRYTRRVTAVWVGFFAVNALVATLLALYAPLAWWTLYTGVIAYALMGTLFAGEWLLRQRVRARG